MSTTNSPIEARGPSGGVEGLTESWFSHLNAPIAGQPGVVACSCGWWLVWSYLM